MHVISKKKLRAFWQQHADAESPLRTWLQTAKQGDWTSFDDVRKVFASADQVGEFVVFNIGGNKYRLIAAIHYNRRRVYVRHVLKHAEYDLGKWKYG